MNAQRVLFQCWAGSADDDIFFLADGKTIEQLADMRVKMGDLLVWGQKLDPNLNQDTLGKTTSGISTVLIILQWFQCENTLLISEVDLSRELGYGLTGFDDGR